VRLTGSTDDPQDQALCLKPEHLATLDQAMCAGLHSFDPGVMVAAQRMIAIRQKITLNAHRLIVPARCGSKWIVG
jgi:hypothetical protein